MVETMNKRGMEVARRTQAQEEGIVESSVEFATRFSVDPQYFLTRSLNGTGEVNLDGDELVFGTQHIMSFRAKEVVVGVIPQKGTNSNS